MNAGNTLRDLGVEQDQIDAVVDAIDPGQLVDLAMSVLSGTLGVLGDLFFLFTVLLFMAFDTDSTRRSLATLGDRFPDPVAALANFARGTRNYMGVSAGFGLIVAVIDGVVLYLMGVPGAFVWAVLAFVTNFIPNIGFVIGVIPPALIALLDGGPGLMVAVIVVYSVINFVIQSVIQPRVVGDTVGLSPILTFLSLVFWTWVIGPLGALLAVPLTPAHQGAAGRGRSPHPLGPPPHLRQTRTGSGVRAGGSSTVDVDDLDGVVAVAEPVPRGHVGLHVPGGVGRAARRVCRPTSIESQVKLQSCHAWSPRAGSSCAGCQSPSPVRLTSTRVIGTGSRPRLARGPCRCRRRGSSRVRGR